MIQMNIHDAKTNLSRLVEAVESGTEAEVILARNGRPAVKIVPITVRAKATDASKRIGIAKGKFTVPDSIDRDNELIERLFAGSLD